LAKRHRTVEVVTQPPVFNPLTREQEEAYEACEENDVVFLTGAAGGGKTFAAIAFAVDQLLAKNIEKIVLARPAIEACGENLGYGPGTFNQKLAPYARPMHENVREYAPKHIDQIFSSMETIPLAFMRGLTLRKSVVIVDEAQNCNMKMLRMTMTRLGRGSTMILCGDPVQNDIRDSPLDQVAKEISGEVDRVAWVRFRDATSTVRHPLIPKINRVFDRMEGKL
jgi:phosphate starvation-inducible PhoH-like protein